MNIRRSITHIKSSIFDFNINKPKNCSRQKYCVVNNHYPRQGDHQWRSTVMNNIFPSSKYQNNFSIRVNCVCVSLKVTGHDRVNGSNGPQQQSTFFLHQKVSLLLCSYNIIFLHIYILNSMLLSIVIPLV